MKRRLPRGVEYAQDGAHGRPAKEIAKRWMRIDGKRRIRRLERREGKRLEDQ